MGDGGCSVQFNFSFIHVAPNHSNNLNVLYIVRLKVYNETEKPALLVVS